MRADWSSTPDSPTQRVCRLRGGRRYAAQDARITLRQSVARAGKAAGHQAGIGGAKQRRDLHVEAVLLCQINDTGEGVQGGPADDGVYVEEGVLFPQHLYRS